MTEPLEPEVSDEPEVTIEPEEEHFTDEESAMFKSLINVGALSKTVNVYGHKIVIRTLNVDEDLQVGLLLKPFDGTHAFERAYKSLIVAAAMRSIDGEPILQALSPMDDIDTNSVQVKWDKVKTYYPSVVDQIYHHLTLLEADILPVLSRLGKSL